MGATKANLTRVIEVTIPETTLIEIKKLIWVEINKYNISNRKIKDFEKEIEILSAKDDNESQIRLTELEEDLLKEQDIIKLIDNNLKSDSFKIEIERQLSSDIKPIGIDVKPIIDGVGIPADTKTKLSNIIGLFIDTQYNMNDYRLKGKKLFGEKWSNTINSSVLDVRLNITELKDNNAVLIKGK